MGGNDKLPIALGTDLAKVFDRGIVEVRKWTDALLEWEGMCR